MPELRKDPIVGRWVIIATERVRRPADFTVAHPPRRGGPCALCAGHEHETPPEILAYRDAGDGAPDAPGWRVRVVPNKFPLLRIEGDLERRGQGLYDLMNGVGAHEVIVESPDHDVKLGDLPLGAVADVVRAYRDRIADLRHDPRFRSATVLKTHGLEAGASLEHPHSQLLATPVVPLTVAEELDRSREYHRYRERCVFCDVLTQELEERTRLVVESEHAVAFAPFAARFPFETWIVPRGHRAAFENVGAAEQHDVARVLRAVLRKLDHAIGDPPFSLSLHSAPFGASESPYYHWHFEVTPALTRIAGFAAGTGVHLNPLPPEDAARFLRDAPD